MRKTIAALGLLVLSGGLLRAETSTTSYCQTHCQATDVRAQINDLEKDIQRAEIKIASTKFIVADRTLGDLAEKRVRLAELKKQLADLDSKLASVKE